MVPVCQGRKTRVQDASPRGRWAEHPESLMKVQSGHRPQMSWGVGGCGAGAFSVWGELTRFVGGIRLLTLNLTLTPVKFEFWMKNKYFCSICPMPYMGHTYTKNYSRFI